MNSERKAKLGDALIGCVSGMQRACDAILEEALERNLVYPIHGEQVASPPGAVGDLWKIRTKCVDGYARTFDEMRRTIDIIGEYLAKEEQG